MKSPYDIIRKPIVTENSMSALPEKKYTFEVAVDANKIEIKNAVQEIFKVKVKKVTTTKIRRKFRRQRGQSGYTAEGKKAVVSLTEDSKTIEFFDGMM